ncbi:AIR synthase related protein, C-terminal domain [Popillia japonica]|uniref:AIR synthase related protein, C-terminal domain n=1 Tax=Popillia japonica TaxID=7064 RepID=A0AAW1NIV3_POPJA
MCDVVCSGSSTYYWSLVDVVYLHTKQTYSYRIAHKKKGWKSSLLVPQDVLKGFLAGIVSHSNVTDNSIGRITCANVLSDVYATGCTKIDSLTLIISLSENMTEREQNTVMPLIMNGFRQNAESAGLIFNLNSAVHNPWCIIGGTATAVCSATEYINPLEAVAGQVLVLTKPLGAQIACNANRWCEKKERWEKLSKVTALTEIQTAYKCAVSSMIRLNKHAAELMHKYKAKAATDVTGFGILGHARNLAAYQKNKIKFVITALPVIKNVMKMAAVMGVREKFLKGTTPETSGGLLISMDEDVAGEYCNELKSIEGWDCWIVGKVVEGENEAIVVENPNIIEVEYL